MGENLIPADILVVDDTPANLRLLVEILGQAGYTARPVRDGKTALAAAQSAPPDLILLDAMMPEMDGFEVCRRLKEQPELRDIPVIFISALSAVMDKVKAFEVGGVDYITKPVQVGEVMARVKTHLSIRALQQRLLSQNERLQQYAERLRIMNEVGQAILAAQSPETIALVALSRIRQLIPCQRVAVYELTALGSMYTLGVESSKEVTLQVSPEMYKGIIDDTLRSGRVHGVEDLAGVPQRTEIQEQLYAEGICSYLVIPMRVGDNLVGTMHLEATKPQTFTPEHINIALEIAVTLAMALRQARLYERAQQEIDARKRAETALRQHTQELEASNAELDAFAHTVAHDLKSPLTVTQGFCDLLTSHFDRSSREDLREGLDIIRRNSLRMTNIVNELLLLSSVRKLEDVEITTMAMEEVVAEVLERVAPLQDELGGEISVPESWPVALGHAPWVAEVWVNYVSNAFKYGGRPEEGRPPKVELGADFVASPQAAGAQSAAPSVRFWVRDNGTGLTPDEQTRLFSEFTRLHQVRAEGHGLGLSIVRRIVEKLGGQVGVTSEIGEGSTFYFTLPAGAAQEELSLEGLPLRWLANLYEVAVQQDSEQAQALIATLPTLEGVEEAHATRIAQALSVLVAEGNYEYLFTLIEQVGI